MDLIMSIQEFKSILFFFFGTMMVTGCSSSKTVNHSRDLISNDSIIIKERVVYYPSISDTVYIPNPCDSLGNFKAFKETFTTGQGKITIESKNNVLRAKIKLNDVTHIDKSSSRVFSKESSEIKDSTVIKSVSNWKLITALIISIIANLLLIARKNTR